VSALTHRPLDWKVLALAGPDRKEFLHGQVTADVKGMAAGAELPCCLLTPKGRLQAHFWVYDLKDKLVLICPPETVESLKTALGKVLPLSDSKLEDLSSAWTVIWASGKSAERGLPFSALGPEGRLVLVEPGRKEPLGRDGGRALTDAEWERLRVERGLPRFGADMDDTTIPPEARLDNTLCYTKGCYMGQETISRIHHLGHVNRLLVGLRFSGEAPQPGVPVLKDGAETGKLTSAAGDLALATIRREDAVPGAALSAGGKDAVVVDLWS
jgi:folate-binding protein YgfZ